MSNTNFSTINQLVRVCLYIGKTLEERMSDFTEDLKNMDFTIEDANKYPFIYSRVKQEESFDAYMFDSDMFKRYAFKREGIVFLLSGQTLVMYKENGDSLTYKEFEVLEIVLDKMFSYSEVKPLSVTFEETYEEVIYPDNTAIGKFKFLESEEAVIARNEKAMKKHELRCQYKYQMVRQGYVDERQQGVKNLSIKNEKHTDEYIWKVVIAVSIDNEMMPDNDYTGKDICNHIKTLVIRVRDDLKEEFKKEYLESIPKLAD